MASLPGTSSKFVLLAPSKWLVVLVVASGLAYLGILLYAYSPGGSMPFLLVPQAILAIVSVGTALIIPGGLLGALIPRFRHGSLKVAKSAGIIFVAAVLCLIAGDRLRMFEFAQLAKRGEPIIKAIHEFEQKNSRSPKYLGELLPDYFLTPPSTGMGIYPSFEYEVYSPYAQDAWELQVPCPEGVLNMDILFYRPSKQYDSREHGGWVERIGDWDYVHE